MLRVAYVALAPFIGGAERSLQIILIHALNYKIEPFLIAPKNSPLLKWAKDMGIKTFGVKLPVLSLRNILPYYISYYKLKKWLKIQEINIVHSNQLWSFPLIAQVATSLNLTKICHFRDPISKDDNWWLKYKVDVAICVSKHIEDKFHQLISKNLYKNLKTLINPVLLPEKLSLNDLKNLKIDSRKKLDLNVDVFIFGFIGQIREVKGLFETLEILKKIKNMNWHFVVAGEDNSDGKLYLNKCKEYIKLNGLERYVTFIGFIDDTKVFYHAVDVIIMLSKEEPLGRVPLEAGSYYTPVIANRTGGLPETIKHDYTGWLVDMWNLDEVLRILNESMMINLMTIGKNARKLSEDIAEPNIYMKSLFSIYFDALNIK